MSWDSNALEGWWSWPGVSRLHVLNGEGLRTTESTTLVARNSRKNRQLGKIHNRISWFQTRRSSLKACFERMLP